MGMAASQSRFLGLTSRKSRIEYQEMLISNQKISLARDTQKITKEYQEALNKKRLKKDILSDIF